MVQGIQRGDEVKKIILSFCIVCVIALSYFYCDPFIAYWAKGEITGGWSDFFQIVTKLGDSIWYLVGFALGYGIFKFWKKNERLAFVCAFFWGSVVVSGVMADIIKWIAGRYRPRMMFEEGLYGFDFFHIKHTMTSFPSGHSATAFALAMAVALLFPRYRVLAFGVAVMVAMSRVMVSAHYVSDVIAGSCVGIVGVLLLARHPKVAPNLRCGKITA